MFFIMVFKFINTFKYHYIDPFDPFLGKKTLYNVSSGAAMPAEVTDYLLLLHEKGKYLSKDFLQSRILTMTKRFHDKITRSNIKMLLTKKLAPPARSNKEPNNRDMNQNVLGQLVLYSLKSDYKINFEEALKYPLAKIKFVPCWWNKAKQLKVRLTDSLRYPVITCSCYSRLPTKLFRSGCDGNYCHCRKLEDNRGIDK